MATKRTVAIVLTCLLASVLALLTYRNKIRPALVRRELASRVDASLYSLMERRPDGISKGEWEFIIGWTLNGHANCMGGTERVDLAEYAKFADMLENRSRKHVDLALIDWIWDEIERIGVDGQKYSAEYRPTRYDRFRGAQEGCFGFSSRVK